MKYATEKCPRTATCTNQVTHACGQHGERNSEFYLLWIGREEESLEDIGFGGFPLLRPIHVMCGECRGEWEVCGECREWEVCGECRGVEVCGECREVGEYITMANLHPDVIC